jgi:hypothetical protein
MQSLSFTLMYQAWPWNRPHSNVKVKLDFSHTHFEVKIRRCQCICANNNYVYLPTETMDCIYLPGNVADTGQWDRTLWTGERLVKNNNVFPVIHCCMHATAWKVVPEKQLTADVLPGNAGRFLLTSVAQKPATILRRNNLAAACNVRPPLH